MTEFYDFVEGAYPAVPAYIGDRLELIYQQDYEPGLTPSGGVNSEQYIMHVSFDKDTFDPISSTDETTALAGAVTLTPNPASEGVFLNFELPTAADVKVAVYSMFGSQICFSELENRQAGVHNEWIPLHDVVPGLYFVKLEMEGTQVTKKLILN